MTHFKKVWCSICGKEYHDYIQKYRIGTLEMCDECRQYGRLNNMAKIELSLTNQFLDRHLNGELEYYIWQWLSKYEISQGDLEAKKLRMKIVVEGLEGERHDKRRN